MIKRNALNKLIAVIAALFFCFLGQTGFASEALSNNKHLQPGTHNLALTVNGFERTYIAHVPQNYSPARPTALVIMLHGGGGTAKAAMWETGWVAKADQEEFVAVFPNALPPDPQKRSNFISNPQLWNDGSDRFFAGQKAPDDVYFLNAMLDDLLTRLAVDERRIFVTGFSNGASMSFLVGIKLAHRIAAIAPVAGACWLESPQLTSPVSLLYLTGTEDPLNLIEGGVPRLAGGQSDKIRGKAKPPVRDSINKWVKALHCSPAPTNTARTDGIQIETYGSCRKPAEVNYITVEGLGHTWAGGKSILPERMVGKTTDKINATNVIWDFFKKREVIK